MSEFDGVKWLAEEMRKEGYTKLRAQVMAWNMKKQGFPVTAGIMEQVAELLPEEVEHSVQ